jgi:hypothetical protein
MAAPFHMLTPVVDEEMRPNVLQVAQVERQGLADCRLVNARCR